jgi:hypothetical protein
MSGGAPKSNMSDEEKRVAWSRLSEAGLTEIPPGDVPARIKEAKQVALGRLSQLLETANRVRERESVAQSVGTLRKLEKALSHAWFHKGPELSK